ncbi:Snf7 [Fragilaria crotonensis]|nr:Snf7 [Fragilaria crotonensis]
MNFFKPKPTPKQAAMAAKKETKKEVRSGQRDLEREIRDLDRQEKQVMAELKQRARAPGVNPATDSALKAMAKQLVNVRANRAKLFSAKAHLGAVGMNASSMASQVAAATAVGSVTTAMASANSAMSAKDTAKIMAMFQMENERLQVKEEMMNDALADAFDNDEMEEEADNVTNQVLAELGVELDSKFGGLNAPMAKPQNDMSVEEQEALESVLPDLKARLNAL